MSTTTTTKRKVFKKSEFSFEKLVGRGRFGKVYAGKEKKSGFNVAIKAVEKVLIREADLDQQLFYEMYIHSKLKHPNIIRLYAYFHDVTSIYLVMEYASQGSLYENMRRQKYKRFTEDKAAKFIYQTADALSYVHHLGYVHGDLKPENILLDGDGNVKLTDFGLSWPAVATSLRGAGVCGTRDYFAPELLNGSDYDETLDLWCLGVVCFELLVGRSPFASKHKEVTIEKITAVDLKFPKIVPEDAVDLIQRLIQYDPNERLRLDKVMSHKWISSNYDHGESDCNCSDCDCDFDCNCD